MYEIALVDEKAGTTISIPAAAHPDEIKMSLKMDNEKHSILTVGEVIVPGKPALRSYEFEFILPHDGPQRPIHYLNWLRGVAESRRNIRLVIARSDSPSSMGGSLIYNKY